jgi:putative NIF3 family GTP cyclohydrolase 1 type 2
VRGIATTMMATFDVLQRAAKANCNFVITHEPTFYNHEDATTALTSDPVYAAKRAFLEKNGMAVMRFHDNWHARRPDGIRTGMLQILGWDKFQSGYMDLNGALRSLSRTDLDVMVIGEAREWEGISYVQDAITAGRPKGLIVLGHVISEENGMNECARWLKTFVSEVPVEFIAAGEPFWSPQE